MASPYRHPSWIARQSRSHPASFIAGIACAAAVVVVAAAVTNVFGLVNHGGGSHGTSAPNLNPYDERILAVDAAVSYVGSATGYFPALEGEDLCAAVCPELPTEYVQYTPPQLGFYIYYNVTDTSSYPKNISLPVLTTSGSDPTIFQFQVMCCYAGLGGAYSEWVMGTISLTPSVTIGFAAYVWTTEVLPYSGAGGYTLYYNVTAS